MTKHLFLTGASLLAVGYKTARDLRWYAARRLAEAGETHKPRSA
jgi:hypothetical protein